MNTTNKFNPWPVIALLLTCLLITLLITRCGNTTTPEVLKAQHNYDSIKAYNVKYQKCLDCEIRMMSKGIDKETATKQCEAIWMK